MKSFRVHFPKSIVFLAYAGIIVCAAVFGATLWRCIDRGGFTDPLASVQYTLLFALSVFTVILLLLIVYNSKYIVTETELITSFAFVKNRHVIAELEKIVFDRKTCRIAVYTAANCFILRLNEEWSGEFIDCLLARGRHILYDETEEPEEPKKDDGNGKNEEN